MHNWEADGCRSDSDMVAGALRWALLYLAALPDVQTAMQQELDTVVGRTKCPTTQVPNI